jgi:hypothetical protein
MQFFVPFRISFHGHSSLFEGSVSEPGLIFGCAKRREWASMCFRNSNVKQSKRMSLLENIAFGDTQYCE